MGYGPGVLDLRDPIGRCRGAVASGSLESRARHSHHGPENLSLDRPGQLRLPPVGRKRRQRRRGPSSHPARFDDRQESGFWEPGPSFVLTTTMGSVEQPPRPAFGRRALSEQRRALASGPWLCVWWHSTTLFSCLALRPKTASRLKRPPKIEGRYPYPIPEQGPIEARRQGYRRVEKLYAEVA